MYISFRFIKKRYKASGSRGSKKKKKIWVKGKQYRHSFESKDMLGKPIDIYSRSHQRCCNTSSVFLA